MCVALTTPIALDGHSFRWLRLALVASLALAASMIMYVRPGLSIHWPSYLCLTCQRPLCMQGERFDLRLPYVEQGWVEESDTDEESVGFFENLLSGGRLQREADARRRQKEGESE